MYASCNTIQILLYFFYIDAILLIHPVCAPLVERIMAAYIILRGETYALDDKPKKEKKKTTLALLPELGERFVVLSSPTPTTNEKA